MSLLSEIITQLTDMNVPVETGVFQGVAPDEYIVITPLTDTFEVFADDRPHFDVQEARLSLFSKKNYQARKNQIVRTLLEVGIRVTDRRYIGHEDDTGYHHYAIDVAKEYEF